MNKQDTPLVGKLSREKVGGTTVSGVKVSSDFTTPLPVIVDIGEGRELVISIRAKGPAKRNTTTLKDVWLPDAPFSFDYFTSELIRHNVINEDLTWILRPIRGNHPTASVHVRGCYEALLFLRCIDEVSFPNVQRLFNDTFQTDIHCSKVIENKNRCNDEMDFFIAMFQAFANPDTNPESE